MEASSTRVFVAGSEIRPFRSLVHVHGVRRGGPTLEEQARQAFDNLRRVLEAGGGGMDRVGEYAGAGGGYLAVRGGECVVCGVLCGEPAGEDDDAGSAAEGLLFSIGCVVVG
jgi:hypothetical protein